MEAHSKESLLTTLSSQALALGGHVTRLGGDNHAVVVDRQIRLAVALKDSDQSKKMWVGVPQPLFELLLGRRTPWSADHRLELARLRIALIHKPVNTILSIPLHSVFEAIFGKASANRSPAEWSFDVHRLGYHKYVIRSAAFREDIPIRDIGFETILPLISAPFAERSA